MIDGLVYLLLILIAFFAGAFVGYSLFLVGNRVLNRWDEEEDSQSWPQPPPIQNWKAEKDQRGICDRQAYRD